MSKKYNLTGTSGTVELSKGGAKIKNSSGILEARDNADAAYAVVRGDTAVGANDLVTLTQLNTATHFVSADLAFGTSSPLNIGAAVPTGKRILNVRVIVDTVFNGTAPTLEIGKAGSTSILMTTAQNNLKVSDSYANEPVYVTTESTQFIGTYVADTSSAGAATIVIEYV